MAELRQKRARRPQMSPDPLIGSILRARRLLRKDSSEDLRTVTYSGGREADAFYRDRWSHNVIVRSTHGVNCTGSCSWKVYVKDGIIGWETQEVDYPSIGADMPEYEPRGCPRGATFSWYEYSPMRVRYPYVRGVLLDMYREAKTRLHDPVDAWADVVGDTDRRQRYHKARGKGGLVRVSWDEALEIIAAAQVHTIKRWGPDRCAGYSPIPAMSMVSHAAGSRYMSLIGGEMLSFYDWYADLPIASPQVFGDQTDVPESADWYNAAYLIDWGTNITITRTPDAHFMAEGRYHGTKLVVVSPDYSDHTKFADEWLPANPGTDGALAMAMGHVILREFYVDRQTPFFSDYARQFTDMPFLVSLEERPKADGAGRDGGRVFVADHFLTAADLGGKNDGDDWRTVVFDEAKGAPAVPNGTLGDRHTGAGKGRWNLDLGTIRPALTLLGRGENVAVDLPRFDVNDGANEGGSVMHRGVPAVKVGNRWVTTVFDLMLAQYGVGRPGVPGEWPKDLDDPAPCTPAWQQPITGVPAATAARIAREFAQNAVDSGGRSMILMGAGTNHWFHSDETYRTMLALLLMCGCEGRNGGGWAHYVGQEKIRPLTGWSTLAFAQDWSRPPRWMAGTSFYYLFTDQWRYEGFRAEDLASPLGKGSLKGKAVADCIVQAARMGWTPAYPTFDRNPLDLVAEAEKARLDPIAHTVDQLRNGRLRFACEDPDAAENWPRVLIAWRGNVIGCNGKGQEYFLRHLLGTDNAVRAQETPAKMRPSEVVWREDAGPGKLDLLVSINFRMTSTDLFGDVLLPAATWYEKYDISSTDMHPFVHSFNAAIAPPWEARSDWDAFVALAQTFSKLAAKHLGVRRDLVAVPLLHDTPGETAQAGGRVLDWRKGECEPIPGKTMPNLVVIERDYGAVGAKMVALGPRVEELGVGMKGVSVKPEAEVELLKGICGTVRGGPADGRPSLLSAQSAAEAILTLSGTTNGRLATAGLRKLEERTGRPLADLAADQEGRQIRFSDTQARPQTVITSFEWSGTEHGGRRYAPFTQNVERLKPWHTLTGRQHFFLDHEWMAELGEQLPAYRPPLNMQRIFGAQGGAKPGPEVTVRYITPHSKWSIHSTYQDNPYMLTLSRGGLTIWMSPQDAATIGVKDNDWIEAYNRNGVTVARAIVSHRFPPGTAFMYHAQDRTVDTPIAELSNLRGGTNNAVTRLLVKPTHLIGGYGQFSYAWNYYGPTGNQRDHIVVIRRRSQEVSY
jgi:nitrate reductase / nitrite oxidoreductase, alpha subunit